MRAALSACVLACALALALAAAGSAQAGTYQVRACHADGINASWGAVHDGTTDAYFECPGGVAGAGRPTDGMIARNTYSTARAPGFSSAMVFFDAPPGASVAGISGEARLAASGGWQAGVRDQGSGSWLWCGPNCLTTYGGWYPFSAGGLATGRLAGLLICASGDGCDRDRLAGLIALRNVTVTVADDSQPSVSIPEEGLAAPGWHRGVVPLVVNARDNVGIRRIEVFAGERSVGLLSRSCDDHLALPCPSTVEPVRADTTALPDGRTTLRVVVTDSAGNTSTTPVATAVDNAAPTSVRELGIEGGEGWRTSASIALRWLPPAEPQHAALTGIRYSMCRVDSAPGTCVDGSTDGAVERVDDLLLPGNGLWTVSVWLRDAAGNEDVRFRRSVTVGLDDSPPQLESLKPRSEDPARLRFRASDALSGIARGEVELRRRGTAAWRPIPAEVGSDGFSAFVDDESLERGAYEVRARVFDRAGNERSLEAGPIEVPLRVDTALRAGRRGLHRLLHTAEIGFGKRLKLRGRLTAAGGNPLAGREVEVLESPSLELANWRRVGAVRTSRSGRFSYFAPRGTSRVLRFRFPGTPTIRPASHTVQIRVRAAATMSSSRHAVVNGEEVTFHGRLKGGHLPPTGKLLQLQAFSRRRWLTFATPRADARTGKWRYRYRFAATRGRVRYRFRVRIPKEAEFPYATGTSRTVRVLVRGL